MEFKKGLITAAKGVLVGGTMLVPGVSGGTMCILLGIYDQLIHAVSTFFQNMRSNFLLLLWFCAGSGLGMFLLSQPLFQLMEYFPRPAGFFFMGAVAGSIPLTFQKAKVTKFTWHVPVFVVAGMVIVWGLAKLPTMEQMEGGGLEQVLRLVIAGVVAAVALILPGISVSYLLLVFAAPGAGSGLGHCGHHQAAGAPDGAVPPGHLPDHFGLCDGLYPHNFSRRAQRTGASGVRHYAAGRIWGGL